MASLPIRYRLAAIQELSDTIAHYSRVSEKLANEFRETVRIKLHEAAKTPHRWALQADDSREILLGMFPYVMVVREARGALHIIAIAHTSRDSGYWRDRLAE